MIHVLEQAKNEREKGPQFTAESPQADLGLASEQPAITEQVLNAQEAGETAEAAEGFSEAGRQTAKKPPVTQGKVSQDNQAALKAHLQPLPEPKKMQQQIMQALRYEIRQDERRIFWAYVGIKKISPNRLAVLVAKIRKLKNLLASLLESSKEVLTELYLKWVRGGTP